ncbi:hypothetical protein CHLRE_03g208385v5 [Chlamydomonas reinhardtii]|uniref:Uncharacterized protein n=1 Tax=Chlamydomonas reinhardtii TaxID=3055 RepID=A0A2K3DZS9_CHLRE|nr:uncharacterized protein CHLRE_03g208385v5 [Chlamydomonas reinhardtii]PNW86046.1 hypothetical protein CHLRE_03g208385v5 [Chlamydomonas reinhardtii]
MDAGAPAPEGLELPDGLLEAIQLHLNLSVLAVLWTAFILPAIATSIPPSFASSPGTRLGD